MVAVVVLAGLVLAAGLSERSRVCAAALAAVSVLWLFVNGPMEGPVLLTITSDHGLTGADLGGFTGLALAAFHWTVLRRRARRTARRPGGTRTGSRSRGLVLDLVTDPRG
jgi:hypothetical protein